MLVSEIMTADPLSISSDSTLREALEAMASIDCHHLPVLSAAGHVVGMITARDCRLALHLPDVRPEYWHGLERADELRVRDVMSPAPIIVEPETHAAEAARLMVSHYVSCLPVMLGETLVGIVTTTDLLVAFVGSTQRTPQPVLQWVVA